MSCQGIYCHVMLCYVMLCHVILSNVMSWCHYVMMVVVFVRFSVRMMRDLAWFPLSSDRWQNTHILLLTVVHLFLPSSDPTSTFDKNTIASHTSSQLLYTPDRSYTIKLSQSEGCFRSQEGFLANQKTPFTNVKLTVKSTLYSPNWFFTKQSHLDFIKFLE